MGQELWRGSVIFETGLTVQSLSYTNTFDSGKVFLFRALPIRWIVFFFRRLQWKNSMRWYSFCTGRDVMLRTSNSDLRGGKRTARKAQPALRQASSSGVGNSWLPLQSTISPHHFVFGKFPTSSVRSSLCSSSLPSSGAGALSSPPE